MKITLKFWLIVVFAFLGGTTAIDASDGKFSAIVHDVPGFNECHCLNDSDRHMQDNPLQPGQRKYYGYDFESRQTEFESRKKANELQRETAKKQIEQERELQKFYTELEREQLKHSEELEREQRKHYQEIDGNIENTCKKWTASIGSI